MVRATSALGVLLLALENVVTAAPTWPASTDDLEDLLYVNTGYRARGFASPVIPCSNGEGADRNSAAEWIRTAFHDMASAHAGNGVGGTDGSILYELGSAEHAGAAFRNTLTRYAPYYSSQTSLADLIAAGVYSATRSCGGPAVPIRGGRIDATGPGPTGQIPDAANAIGIFRNQFTRMGTTNAEMIQLVACGHTLGGVHAAEQPQIINSGEFLNNYAHFDTSVASFDNRIATEFLSNSTKNPMVYGKAYRLDNRGRDSDRRVFGSDSNVTMRAMQDPQAFNDMCKNVFQKMVEIVPRGVVLTDIITAYDVKPYDVQLTLLDGAASLGFTGEIRVRTNARSVSKVQLIIKDRTGAASSTLIDTTSKGTASGFDDTFTFYGFSTTLSAETSISSFNVVVTTSSGTQTFTNNDSGFAVDDTVIFQSAQSCADGAGKLTVAAAIRGNDSPSVQVVARVPRPSNMPVPSLSTSTVAMASPITVGRYTLYSADLSGSSANAAMFGVFAGGANDNFKVISKLQADCKPFSAGTPASSTSTTPSSTPTSSSALISSASSTSVSSSTPVSSSIPASSSTPSPSPIPLDYQGCFTDAIAGTRALAPAELKDDEMTVEKCAAFCNPYKFFGLEYGRECYCGNVQNAQSVSASASDCNMPCKGDSSQTCGAGQRLSLYKTVGWSPPVNPTIDGYDYFGCYSEVSSPNRALADSITSSGSMTVQMCASFCDGSAFFGVENGNECNCGSKIHADSVPEPEGDCSLLCPGNMKTLCGASQRLNIYKNKTPPTVTTSATPTPTPTSNKPSLSGYTYTGCIVDTLNPRPLSALMTSSSENSYAYCANFCSGFPYFGVEYSNECYCAWVLSTATETKPDGECSMPCSGTSTQYCGGPNRMTVFKSNANIAVPVNPTVESYGYKGCYTDDIRSRVLSRTVAASDSMTVERCASACSGSHYFGTQYGRECYCGDSFASDTKVVDQGECSSKCAGNAREFCGAWSRLSLYESMEHVNSTASGEVAPDSSFRVRY